MPGEQSEGFSTIYSILESSARSHRDSPALWYKNNSSYGTITFGEFKQAVDMLASGLMSLGVLSDARIALISENRLEWAYANMASAAIGAIDVPRGSDQDRNDLEAIINHSGSKTVFIEDEKSIPKILHSDANTIIVMDPEYRQEDSRSTGKKILSFDSVLKKGLRFAEINPKALEKRIASVDPDNPVTIMYTSGTTGTPKGVVLSHSNMMHNINCVPDVIDLDETDSLLSVLPPHHMFGKIVQYIAVSRGSSLAALNPLEVKKGISKIKPTTIVGVPRLWNRLYDTIQANAKKKSAVEKAMFKFFMSVGRAYVENQDTLNNNIPIFSDEDKVIQSAKVPVARVAQKPLAQLYRLGQRVVYPKITENFGGNVRHFITGSAALSYDVELFFRALGIPVYEGYGATELSPAVTFRGPNSNVPGTVGPVLDGLDVLVLGEDHKPLKPGRIGEIAVSGPNLMQGYWEEKKKTKEVFLVLDGDTYYLTGDFGRFDLSGNLQITGRKKNSYKLHNGEWVYPESIESAVTASPLIDYIVPLGENQKTIGLIVSLNEEQTEGLDSEAIRNSVEEEIDRYKEATEYSRHIVPSKFIIASPFRIGKELTHTFKVKRNVVLDNYSAQVKKLYS